MRRRRKRREVVIQEPAVSAHAAEEPEPEPPGFRIVVVGQAGALRDSLETTLQAQPDMEMVGSFDDMDSGTSGIRAGTKRSGVVALVDVAILEAAGTMTAIRHLRDLFPFCRFVAYGDAFNEDAASALLFFGADGVAAVSEGPVAVARSIRRSVRPGEEMEPETEATVEAATEPESPAISAEPAPPEGDLVAAQDGPEPEPDPVPDPVPDPEPERLEDSASPTEPSSSPHDDPSALPEPDKEPTPPKTLREIWPGSPPAEELHRRITSEDIWDRQASEVRFEARREGDPANGEGRDRLGRSSKAMTAVGGRLARTLRRPFRAGAGSGDQSDDRSGGEDTSQRPTDPRATEG